MSAIGSEANGDYRPEADFHITGADGLARLEAATLQIRFRRPALQAWRPCLKPIVIQRNRYQPRRPQVRRED